MTEMVELLSVLGEVPRQIDRHEFAAARVAAEKAIDIVKKTRAALLGTHKDRELASIDKDVAFVEFAKRVIAAANSGDTRAVVASLEDMVTIVEQWIARSRHVLAENERFER